MWEAYERTVLGGPLMPPLLATARQQRWQQRRAFYQGAYMVVMDLAAQAGLPEEAGSGLVRASRVNLAPYVNEYEQFVQDMKAGRA